MERTDKALARGSVFASGLTGILREPITEITSKLDSLGTTSVDWWMDTIPGSDEELDFIINYDIKYRMGGEIGEDDE